MSTETYYLDNFDAKQQSFALTTVLGDFSKSIDPDRHDISCFCFKSKDEWGVNVNKYDTDKVFIFDFHDWGKDAIWQQEYLPNKQYYYFKLQIYDVENYRKIPSHIKILTLPILAGGSRYHITTHDDYLGEDLFIDHLEYLKNPEYLYDVAFINSISQARIPVIEKLKEMSFKHNILLAYQQGGHNDAKNALINYYESLSIHQKSKINISTNGHGPWCLKDAECFSRGCMVLRQYSPTLFLNRLSPIEDVDWVIFRNPQELQEKIEFYLKCEKMREFIRLAGTSYFHNGINGIWSKEYKYSYDQHNLQDFQINI